MCEYATRDSSELVFLSAFWAKKYNEIKNANMKLPILIRESAGAQAKVTATYGKQVLPLPFFDTAVCT